MWKATDGDFDPEKVSYLEKFLTDNFTAEIDAYEIVIDVETPGKLTIQAVWEEDTQGWDADYSLDLTPTQEAEIRAGTDAGGVVYLQYFESAK